MAVGRPQVVHNPENGITCRRGGRNKKKKQSAVNAGTCLEEVVAERWVAAIWVDAHTIDTLLSAQYKRTFVWPAAACAGPLLRGVWWLVIRFLCHHSTSLLCAMIMMIVMWLFDGKNCRCSPRFLTEGGAFLSPKRRLCLFIYLPSAPGCYFNVLQWATMERHHATVHWSSQGLWGGGSDKIKKEKREKLPTNKNDKSERRVHQWQCEPSAANRLL